MEIDEEIRNLYLQLSDEKKELFISYLEQEIADKTAPSFSFPRREKSSNQ